MLGVATRYDHGAHDTAHDPDHVSGVPSLELHAGPPIFDVGGDGDFEQMTRWQLIATLLHQGWDVEEHSSVSASLLKSLKPYTVGSHKVFHMTTLTCPFTEYLLALCKAETIAQPIHHLQLMVPFCSALSR